MIRFFNIMAVLALIGSAMWAYSVKYDTIYYVEEIKKIEAQMNKERDLIAILKADWQHLTKPSRLQILADKYLTLQSLQAIQIVLASELPEHKASPDMITQKIENLGLVTGSTPKQSSTPKPNSTPKQGQKSTGKTPEQSGARK